MSGGRGKYWTKIKIRKVGMWGDVRKNLMDRGI